MAFLFPVLFIAVSLLLSAFPLSCESSYGHGSCIESERTALLTIKEGLFHNSNNNNNNNISWLSSWTGRDCCQWQGVACNQESGHVIKLNLRNPYLQYPYPFDYFNMPPPSKLNSSLLHLPHLKHLDLSMNNFNHSPIPDFIGSLANLEYLNLSNAGFSGAIPHTLGNLSTLRFLDLQLQPYQDPPLFSNNLHWLSGLTSLQHLDLGFVNLSKVSGWLNDINMLPSLRVLKLSSALLQDDTSANTLAHLNFTSLRVLDLSFTNINSLSPWLFNLTSLVYLDLSGTISQGSTDDQIRLLSGFTALQYLDLSSPALTLGGDSKGSSWLHGINMLPNLLVLKLVNTLPYRGIHDTTPVHLNLTSLRVLDLSFNDLNTTFPQWLFNLSSLEQLDLHENQLHGSLPENIGRLRNLRYLDLHGNAINFYSSLMRLGETFSVGN